MIKKLVSHADRVFSSDENIRTIVKSLYQKVKDLLILNPHGHTVQTWFSRNQPFENTVIIKKWRF